jgi:pyruvate/2-oxoglutarate/acetoin dehydrogenase E1 component
MYGEKGEIPEGEYLLPIGVADVKRKGRQVTLVSFGKIIKEALRAAEELEKEGISCEVIDLRTIPADGHRDGDRQREEDQSHGGGGGKLAGGEHQQ